MKSFIYENLNRGGNGTQLESASWKITYDEQVYWHLPFNKNTRQKKAVKVKTIDFQTLVDERVDQCLSVHDSSLNRNIFFYLRRSRTIIQKHEYNV